MSRLMETYDPNWDARWQIAHDALAELQRTTGDGLSPAQIAACQKKAASFWSKCRMPTSRNSELLLTTRRFRILIEA